MCDQKNLKDIFVTKNIFKIEFCMKTKNIFKIEFCNFLGNKNCSSLLKKAICHNK